MDKKIKCSSCDAKSKPCLECQSQDDVDFMIKKYGITAMTLSSASFANKINVCCKSCNSKIATEYEDKIAVTDMKVVSSVEVSGSGLEIKCRTCSNWNTFTPEGQTINYKRKGQEALHNSLKK